MSLAEDIRNYVAAQPLKLEAVPTPFWPVFDGKVFLQDMPGDELISMQSLANRPNLPGQMDNNALVMGALLCKALVCRDDDGVLERIWDDTAREQVARLGASVLKPIFEQAQAFFGLGDAQSQKKAVMSAAPGSGLIPNGSTGTA